MGYRINYHLRITIKSNEFFKTKLFHDFNWIGLLPDENHIQTTVQDKIYTRYQTKLAMNIGIEDYFDELGDSVSFLLLYVGDQYSSGMLDEGFDKYLHQYHSNSYFHRIIHQKLNNPTVHSIIKPKQSIQVISKNIVALNEAPLDVIYWLIENIEVKYLKQLKLENKIFAQLMINRKLEGEIIKFPDNETSEAVRKYFYTLYLKELSPQKLLKIVLSDDDFYARLYALDRIDNLSRNNIELLLEPSIESHHRFYSKIIENFINDKNYLLEILETSPLFFVKSEIIRIYPNINELIPFYNKLKDTNESIYTGNYVIEDNSVEINNALYPDNLKNDTTISPDEAKKMRFNWYAHPEELLYLLEARLNKH